MLLILDDPDFIPLANSTAFDDLAAASTSRQCILHIIVSDTNRLLLSSDNSVTATDKSHRQRIKARWTPLLGLQGPQSLQSPYKGLNIIVGSNTVMKAIPIITYPQSKTSAWSNFFESPRKELTFLTKHPWTLSVRISSQLQTPSHPLYQLLKKWSGLPTTTVIRHVGALLLLQLV